MTRSPRRERLGLRLAGGIAAVWIATVAACAGSQDMPEVGPGPCAARIYLDPHCQKLASEVCCSEMSACAADASCGRLTFCMLECKHNTSETCATACAHRESPSADGELGRGLGLYHAMLACAGRANLAECGPDS